ncbi:MAG: sulfotransferase family 2 domain-containing protein [Prochloraceae cyanobacterium]|nr:sulfotransferase family 2 domain-containing protein [Prochloraceae cyanobacterium]
MNLSNVKVNLKKTVQKLLIPERTKVFFIHIPKTGGTSINYGVRKKYRNQYSRIESAASHQTALMLNREWDDDADMHSTWEIRKQIAIYEMFKEKSFISGHIPFDLNTWKAFQNLYLYITCLRNPVKRYLSQYFYNYYKKSEHRKINVDLPTYITMPIGKHEGSIYVKFLGGISEEKDYTSTEAIARAKENLSKLNLVAFLENLNPFIDQFYAKTGIKISIPHKRKNPVSKPKVDKEILAKIETICTPDLEIYEYARKKYLNQ